MISIVITKVRQLESLSLILRIRKEHEKNFRIFFSEIQAMSDNDPS